MEEFQNSSITKLHIAQRSRGWVQQTISVCHSLGTHPLTQPFILFFYVFCILSSWPRRIGSTFSSSIVLELLARRSATSKLHSISILLVERKGIFLTISRYHHESVGFQALNIQGLCLPAALNPEPQECFDMLPPLLALIADAPQHHCHRKTIRNSGSLLREVS
jgi:hypothetical protein